METGNNIFILEGHSAGVMSVCVSPDGSKIISGSDDKSIRIWDMETGNNISILEGHSGYVMSVCVSPDGSKIISGSFDNYIRILETDV
jgi:WD40 repeat protein